MKTITKGSGSRVGFMLVDEKNNFLVENAWMDDFAGWFAWQYYINDSNVELMATVIGISLEGVLVIWGERFIRYQEKESKGGRAENWLLGV